MSARIDRLLIIGAIQTVMQGVIDILLKPQNMINQEIPTKISTSLASTECLPIAECEPNQLRNCLVFSEQDFVDWCATMTIEDLEDCSKISFPQATTYLRKNWSENNKSWTFQTSEFQSLNASLKNFAINTYKKFTQALLLVSNREYLDCITFNADCFLFPNKLYKLLASVKLIWTFLSEKARLIASLLKCSSLAPKNAQNEEHSFKTFQLLFEIAEKIQKNIEGRMKPQNKFKMKHKQQECENIVYEFNGYWRYCTEEQKLGIWYLGYNDLKKAVSKSMDKCTKIDSSQIQQYVRLAQKIGSKELKQKIFSWKLNRNDNGITDYMQFVFAQLKQRMIKKYKLSPLSKSRKQKKRRSRPSRRPSLSLSQASNETNETDVIYQQEYSEGRRFDVNINELIESKIEKDITAMADDLNQQANKYYDNRVLAFQKIKTVMDSLGVTIKLYGSCCCGLAIKQSDVDVTVPEADLDGSFGYLSDTTAKISAFFQYLECYFANFSWISNVKIIKSATIPIIKFKVDTQPSPTQQQFRDGETQIQFDLTIETTTCARRHLGVVSTKQTRQWLSQISTLQNIAIIIKSELAKRSLNQTYYGGLNTYTLLIMIVAVIRKNNLVKEQRVGPVLDKVFKYYSEEFDEDRLGIDLNHSQIFYAKQGQIDTSNEPNIRKLEIKDPQGDHRVITKNCYQFKAIKQLFSDLHQQLYLRTRSKVEQLCSIWNPKENPFDQEGLLEWVERRMSGDSSEQGMQMVRLE